MTTNSTQPENVIHISEIEANMLQAGFMEIKRIQREIDKIFTISLAARGHKGVVKSFDYSARVLTITPPEQDG